MFSFDLTEFADRLNVGANGRWAMIVCAGLAVHEGAAWLAFMFMLVLLGAWVVDQLSAGARDIGALAVMAWAVAWIGALGWLVVT